jgi:hypothetical protein
MDLYYYNQLSPYWKKDYDKNVGIYTKEYENGEITYDEYVMHIKKYYRRLKKYLKIIKLKFIQSKHI